MGPGKNLKEMQEMRSIQVMEVMEELGVSYRDSWMKWEMGDRGFFCS